jgi:pimeloyl-ACP methyl ester carboxylesterase
MCILNSKNSKPKKKIETNNVEYLFAHGFGGNKDYITHYQNCNFIPKPYKGLSFNGPEVSGGKYPNLSKTAMGQERDIEVITQALKNITAPVVGIGVSKGASTWINAAAHPENTTKIKALVLESPFFDASDVLHKLFFLNYIPGGTYITNKLSKGFLGYYQPSGIQPIHSIKKISNKQLPILLIHSQEDSIVPVEHARVLYNAFTENGFKHVHLIETKKGAHANLAYKIAIQRAVNAFYKRYNIYHDITLTNNTHLYNFQTIE